MCSRSNLTPLLSKSANFLASRKSDTERPDPTFSDIPRLLTHNVIDFDRYGEDAGKTGPDSILQRQFKQAGLMPRAKQKFNTEMLEALIKQQQSA